MQLLGSRWVFCWSCVSTVYSYCLRHPVGLRNSLVNNAMQTFVIARYAHIELRAYVIMRPIIVPLGVLLYLFHLSFIRFVCFNCFLRKLVSLLSNCFRQRKVITEVFSAGIRNGNPLSYPFIHRIARNAQNKRKRAFIDFASFMDL